MTSELQEAIEISRVRRAVREGLTRQIRENAGLSLNEVSTVLGVSEAAVSRWENGQRMPGGENAIRYGALLVALASDRGL